MSSFISQQTTPLSAQQQAICRQCDGGITSIGLLEIPNPSHQMVEKVATTWQSFARKHSILRTRIVRCSKGVYTSEIQPVAHPVERVYNRRCARDGAFLEAVTGDEKTVVVLNVSKALVDKTSLILLQKEFLLCLNGYTSKPNHTMAAYNKHVSQKDFSVASKYWQELSQATGRPSLLSHFPGSYEWPRVETVATSSTTLVDSISAFSDEHDLRPQDLLYAAWAATADRHTLDGQGNACFVVDGRDRSFSKHETVIGLVDQKFPLLLSVPDDTDVLNWISHVGKTTAEASTNAFIGYDEILQNANLTQPQVKFSIRIHDKHNEVMTDDDPEFSLVMNVTIAEQLELSLRHNASVPAEDAQNLLKHFLVALENMLHDPTAKMSDVQIVSAEGSDVVMQHSEEIHQPQSLHSTPLDQPMKVAAKSLKPHSSSAVNTRANHLARQITKYRSTRPAVSERTNPDLVFALLAILEAGAAYVAMDTDLQMDKNTPIENSISSPRPAVQVMSL